MNKKILSLEELKEKGQFRTYLSMICPYLEYKGRGYWRCTRFDNNWGCLAGKVVYKGKSDCMYRDICEGEGKNERNFFTIQRMRDKSLGYY